MTNDKEPEVQRSETSGLRRPKSAATGRSSLVCCLILFFSTFVAADEPKRYEFDSIRMGVSVRIVLYSTDADKAREASQAAFEQFQQLNAVMSDYDSDSELSQLTERRKESESPIPVSVDLFAVLKSAKHFSDISDGAFDVTVAPYTRLWRRAKRQGKLPEPRLMDQARELVGNDLWGLDEASKTVRLQKPGMRFDLGGIAKGYAIDRAFEIIVGLGIETVLVDAGGDFRLGKAPSNGWQIDLDGETITTLENVAMATSGDKLRYLIVDGIRYSHIIDPRTGSGLTESSTVHVIAPTTTEADALASALSVLGPERGIELVESQKNASAKIILHEGGRVLKSKQYQSHRWGEMVSSTMKSH